MNREMMDAIQKVKPLSPALVNLLEVTAKQEHSLKHVLDIIQLDAVLTAAILRAANSAAFRPAGEVHSLNVAVSLLGERMVVGLAMSLCTDGFFDQPLVGYESVAGDLWRHSIKTAIAARLFSRYARRPLDSSQAFTGGILHDIGKVVLSAFLEGSARELALSVSGEQEGQSYLDAERKKLGSDHCEAGLLLANQWRLPECYRGVIGWHHHPEQAPEALAPLVFAVHLGDALAMMTGADTGSDSLLYPLHPNHKNYFELTSQTIQRIVLEMEQEFAAIQTSVEHPGE